MTPKKREVREALAERKISSGIMNASRLLISYDERREDEKKKKKKKKKKIARSTPVPKSEKGGGIFAIPWKATSRENTANYIGSRPKRSLVENIFESFLRGWCAVSCLY